MTRSGGAGVAMSMSPIGRSSSASRTEPPTNRASTPPPSSASSTALVAGSTIQGCGAIQCRLSRSLIPRAWVRCAPARSDRLASAAGTYTPSCGEPKWTVTTNSTIANSTAPAPASQIQGSAVHRTAPPLRSAPIVLTHSRYNPVGKRSGRTIVRKTRSMASSTREHLGQIDQHSSGRAPDVPTLERQHEKDPQAFGRAPVSCDGGCSGRQQRRGELRMPRPLRTDRSPAGRGL